MAETEWRVNTATTKELDASIVVGAVPKDHNIR
jgi:hypothetical protein